MPENEDEVTEADEAVDEADGEAAEEEAVETPPYYEGPPGAGSDGAADPVGVDVAAQVATIAAPRDVYGVAAMAVEALITRLDAIVEGQAALAERLELIEDAVRKQIPVLVRIELALARMTTLSAATMTAVAAVPAAPQAAPRVPAEAVEEPVADDSAGDEAVAPAPPAPVGFDLSKLAGLGAGGPAAGA